MKIKVSKTSMFLFYFKLLAIYNSLTSNCVDVSLNWIIKVSQS